MLSLGKIIEPKLGASVSKGQKLRDVLPLCRQLALEFNIEDDLFSVN